MDLKTTSDANTTAVIRRSASATQSNMATENMEPASTDDAKPGKKTASDSLGSKFSVKKIIDALGGLADPSISAVTIFSAMTSSILWLMIGYLTDEWKLTYTYGAGIRNIWSGTILVLPLILIHVADTFTGDFYFVALSSIIYTIGLGILSASNPPARCDGTALEFATCAKRENTNLYTGLVISALGVAGIGTSLPNFRTQDVLAQDNDIKRYCSFKAFFIWLVVTAASVVLFFIYFEKIKSWVALFLISASFMGFASLCFISGKRKYKADTGLPKSSENRLIVTILRVLVASALKILYRRPRSQDLYKDADEIEPLESTRGFRCLDKAAIISPGSKTIEEQKKNRWTLCSVTEVEKTKMVLRTFPLCGTWILMGVVSSMGDTYFQQQATNLNPKLGKLNVPVVALFGLQKLAGLAFGKGMTWVCKKGVPDQHKRARPVIIVALAMVTSTLCCIVAAKVEQKRLGVVLINGLIDKPNDKIPMTMFLLVPQYMLLGLLDTLFDEGGKLFVLQFIPFSMVKYMILSSEGIRGVGHIGGVLSVFLVGKLTHRKDRDNWFQNTLNRSRLDKYYWVLAVSSAVCLAVYGLVVSWYFYRENKRPELDEIDDFNNSHFVESAVLC